MKTLKTILKLVSVSVVGSMIVLAGLMYYSSVSSIETPTKVSTGEILDNESAIELEDKVEALAPPKSDEQIVHNDNPPKPVETEDELEVPSDSEQEDTNQEKTENGDSEEPKSEDESLVQETEEKDNKEDNQVTESVAADENSHVEPESEPVYTEPVPGVALTDAQGMVIASRNATKYASLVNEVFRIINEYRIVNNVPVIQLDSTLTLVAMHRTAENAWVECFATAMVDGKFHHVRPNGLKASSVFTVYGLSGAYAENMGRYQMTPNEIVLGEYGWKSSATHNALMLSSDYTRVGIGVAQDSDGYYYWTAVFSN